MNTSGYIHARNMKLTLVAETRCARLIPMRHVKSIDLEEEFKRIRINYINQTSDYLYGDTKEKVREAFNDIVMDCKKNGKVFEW